MIDIPDGILMPEEVSTSAGRPAEELTLSFKHISLDREGLVLELDVLTNFDVRPQLEHKMKDRLIKTLGNITDVKFSYFYDESYGACKPCLAVSGANPTEKAKPVSDGVILGKRITMAETSYENLAEISGARTKVAISGDVFEMEIKETRKKNFWVMTLRINKGPRAAAVKAFIKSKQEYETVNESLSAGDTIIVQGDIRYDDYIHENVMIANSINRGIKSKRVETYDGDKRVELHAHTRMSENDGFNDVDEMVKQAADWGQPAIAITDHGVVQSFPDAANTAKKLAKKGKKIKILYGMEGYLYPDDDAYDENGNINLSKKRNTYHIILIAKNLTGLKNLYKIVSYTHIDYFYRRPQLPRRVLDKYKDGLIIGSACEAGEVFQAVLKGASDDELLRIASYYDYLEIQPLGNNFFLINSDRYPNVTSKQDLIDLNMKIVELADKLGKPVVATTDSHYPDKESAIYRNIVMSRVGFGDTNSNSLYLRTTAEMLKEFDYLGERTKEIVIDNTNLIAAMTEEFQPVPDEKCPPSIDGADETLRSTCYANARRIYGEPLPEEIRERLDTELNSIISNGYAVMYVAAQLLVEKSNKDGYLVGSRGSVGSSFAATMAGITEVNPLEPHYICPKCHKLEFTKKLDVYDTGFDMPDKVCVRCGTPMDKNGLNIPFATFLGFNGDKEPDIDLNFAGEYQPIAHKFVGEIFGEKNIFKAGTVATIAEKTAFGYVKKYEEDTGKTFSSSEELILANGCTGTKRTTGQHPGGIIVVPADREIFEFCPVQKPANNRDAEFITTHFDYHKIDKNLLKLDILGHDVPQMIRHLQDMTGVDPLKIDIADKKTLSIFTSIDALNILDPDEYEFKHGTYGIPEFGTNFTRGMLDAIQPKTISALIKISGFSHGTDVWTNNAEDLIKSGVATIEELISCRDDIMNYLIIKGVDKSNAFRIMEDVRKNRELKQDELDIMKKHGVPDWYVESCRTLKYLFPRAHAAAYVIMALRMAWFKVYYPSAFYCAWLSTKIDNFDVNVAGGGINAVKSAMNALNSDDDDTSSAKKKELKVVYEVIYELLSRGCEFSMPELGVSDPCMFNVVDDRINIPFMAVIGVGRSAAISLAEAYKDAPFLSIDEVQRKTKLSSSNIEDLKACGVFDDLPDSAQVSIFDM